MLSAEFQEAQKPLSLILRIIPGALTFSIFTICVVGYVLADEFSSGQQPQENAQILLLGIAVVIGLAVLFLHRKSNSDSYTSKILSEGQSAEEIIECMKNSPGCQKMGDKVTNLSNLELKILASFKQRFNMSIVIYALIDAIAILGVAGLILSGNPSFIPIHGAIALALAVICFPRPAKIIEQSEHIGRTLEASGRLG